MLTLLNGRRHFRLQLVHKAVIGYLRPRQLQG